MIANENKVNAMKRLNERQVCGEEINQINNRYVCDPDIK